MKTYFTGPDGSSEEVVFCPFCKMIVCVPDQAERSDCKHIAFLYDLANGQFTEMDDEFKRQHPVFDLEDQSKVPGLKTYEWNDHWGVGGVIWGFWNRENSTSKPEDETWALETTLGTRRNLSNGESITTAFSQSEGGSNISREASTWKRPSPRRNLGQY